MRIERSAVSTDPVVVKVNGNSGTLKITGYRSIESDLYFSATFYDSSTGLVIGSQIVIGDGDSENDYCKISSLSLKSKNIIVKGFISNPGAQKFSLEFHFSQNNVKLKEILGISGDLKNGFSDLSQIINLT